MHVPVLFFSLLERKILTFIFKLPNSSTESHGNDEIISPSLSYGPGSSVGLATGWTVRGSNPGGGQIFCTCPDQPWGPPSLLYNGYWVFPGGKEWPVRDAGPLPPSSAVVMKE
jgi:hypothetical protein